MLVCAAVAAACSGDGGTTPTAGGPAVSVVRLDPARTELSLGSTLQLTLTALDASSNEVAGRAAAWASQDTTVATVSADGLVTARGLGVVQLQAVVDGRSAFSVVSVVPTRVGAIALTPSSPSVQVGGSLQLAARVTDAGGTELRDRLVFWQSSNGAVALVTSTGLVRGQSAGTATVTASSEGRSATVNVTVAAPPAAPGQPTPPPTTPTTPTPPTAGAVARVQVTPATLALTTKNNRKTPREATLTAALFDAAGRSLTNRSCSWSATTDPAGRPVVEVTPLQATSARVLAKREGKSTVTATCEGRTATAAITVSDSKEEDDDDDE
jgi:uncharacterized protein YjdB